MDWYKSVTDTEPAQQPAPQAAVKPSSKSIDWYSTLAAPEPVASRPKRDLPPAAMYDPDKAADPSSIAAASFADDPQARINYYAQQRGVDPSTYQIVDGRPAYKSAPDSPVYYFEEPPGGLPISMRDAANQVANFPGGEAIPLTMGTAAGIATSPMLLTGPAGMAGSMALTGGAYGLGETIKQWIAKLFTGQDMSPAKIAQQTATGALGQGLGAVSTSWAMRHAAPDIRAMNPARSSALLGKANQQGITLTPAEVTNLASLKGQQKALGNLPQSADDMARFYESRAQNQIAPAVGRYLDDISQIDSPEIAGSLAQRATGAARAGLETARKNAASPIYDKAFSDAIDNNLAVATDDIVAALDDKLTIAKGGIRGALSKAREMLTRTVTRTDVSGKTITETVPETRLDALHQAKMALDDMLDPQSNSGIGRTAQRQIAEIRDSLLQRMDESSDLYREARRTFAERSKPLDAFDETLAGIINKLPQGKAQEAGQVLMNPSRSGPESARRAMSIIADTDPEAAQAIKRSYLESIWQKAGKETLAGEPVNQGAKFRLALLGDAKQRDILKAVMSPKEYGALEDLAEVLQAAGRVKPVGSDTAWNQEMMKVARDNAKPTWAKFARLLRPQDWGKLVEEYATERGLSKNAARLAEIITKGGPEAIAELRELRQVSPNSARFRAGVGHFLTQYAIPAGADAISESDSGPAP